MKTHDWIVEANDCLDTMATVLQELVIDEVISSGLDGFEELVSVVAVLSGQCCEGDYCILEEYMKEKWDEGEKQHVIPAIMRCLHEHEWEEFDMAKALQVVEKLVEHDLLTIRYIKWNGGLELE